MRNSETLIVKMHPCDMAIPATVSIDDIEYTSENILYFNIGGRYEFRVEKYDGNGSLRITVMDEEEGDNPVHEFYLDL